MKKLLTGFCICALALMCIFVLPTTVEAATIVKSGSCGKNVTYTLDSDGVLTISGTGAMAAYGEYFSAPWYNYRSSVKTVVINDRVTTIGDSAFYNCTSLYSVSIPNSVTTIGDSAFYNCTSLTSVTIPNRVTTISDSVFSFCTSLTSVTIPDRVTTIGDSAFEECNSLTSVTIPDRVTTIGDSAFEECNSLTSVTIPDGVTTIGDSVFSFCTSLIGVSIGNSATTIGENAFYCCYRLASVSIGSSVTTIGNSAFYDCDRLNGITIPDSVTTISDSAFRSCDSLTEVYYAGTPSQWNNISVDEHNERLLNATIHFMENTTIVERGNCGEHVIFTLDSDGVLAFFGTGAIAAYGDYSFAPWYNSRSSVKTVVINDRVTTIGSYAFSGCSSLTSVTIPDSVTTIGYSAFYNCDSLTNVYYSGTQSQWNKISIGSDNYDLTSATIHYNHVHDYTVIPPARVEPTCEETGYIDYTCVHGETKQKILPALGHVVGEDTTIVAPTCTEQGYNISTCTRCGEQNNTDFTDALDHDFTGTVTVVDPTCTERGYIVAQCIRCTATENSNYTDELGHKLGYVPAEEATCTAPGKTYGTKCERCDYWGIKQTDVGIELGHSFTNYVSNNDATCTADGTETAKCDRCEETGTRTVADSKLGHNYVNGTCSRCGDKPEGVKITVQPVSAKAPGSKTATVTVKATGDGLTYTWYHKNATASKFAKAGTTGSTYSAYMSSSSNGRYVYCVVADKYGNEVTTNTVRLYMGNFAKITTQPANIAVPSGKYATVTVKATGDGLTYTWYHKNATASKFAKAPQTGADYSAYMSASSNGRYVYCVITDAYGNSVKTNTVKLTMANTVKITAQPKNTVAPSGKYATVTVKATGDGLTYTWYHKNASASKFAKAPQTGATYSAYMSSSSNGRYVYCIVKDQYGNQVKTATVKLIMGNTVKITTQPKTVTVAKNAKATVRVQATGDGLTYTWYHKNASASAFAKAPQTGSSYSAYVTAASNGRYVYCIVKDKYGNQIKTNTVALRIK